MPTARTPDEVPTLKVPLCPVCGKTMQLESSVPSSHYANLDQFKFVCDCGQTIDRIIPHWGLSGRS